MSYDVSFDVVDKISLHRDFLDHYDVINYTFRDQNYINSEFFSITDDGAKNSIMKKLSFDEYINTGFGDFGHENVYANIFNNCKVKTMGHFYSDDRKDPWVIGDFTALPLNTKNLESGSFLQKKYRLFENNLRTDYKIKINLI